MGQAQLGMVPQSADNWFLSPQKSLPCCIGGPQMSSPNVVLAEKAYFLYYFLLFNLSLFQICRVGSSIVVTWGPHLVKLVGGRFHTWFEMITYLHLKGSFHGDELAWPNLGYKFFFFIQAIQTTGPSLNKHSANFVSFVVVSIIEFIFESM